MAQTHTFQIAALLIEAAEEQGEKKESIIQKVKSMLAKAVEWVKDKLAKLTEFLKQKAGKLEETFKKSVEYFKNLFNRSKGSKRKVKHGKISISLFSMNLTNNFLTLAKNIQTLSLTINGSFLKSNEPLEVDLAKIDEQMSSVDEDLNELIENIGLIKEEDQKRIESTLDKYIDEARKALTAMIGKYSEVKKAQQSNLDAMKKMLTGLEASKAKIQKAFNPSFFSKVISKVTKVVGVITRSATSFWSLLAGMVADLISGVAGAFRKKDKDTEATEEKKEDK